MTREERLKETNKACNRAFYETHKDWFKAYRKEYYKTHREELLAYQREYRKTHNAEHNAYQREKYRNDAEYRRKRIENAIKQNMKKKNHGHSNQISR